MADLTIFQLTQILPAAVNGTADLFPIWDDSATETKKITVDDLKTVLGGLVDWTDNFSSATQATSQFAATNAAANVNAAITPKGTGALLVDMPDGTATGGNARGTSAVDLQHVRATNVQVASGNSSVIAGGSNNRASGILSVVSGGTSNIASGDYSFVGGGSGNSAVQFYHTIGGGFNNATQVGADGQTIAGGGSNLTGGSWSSIGGGNSHIANANYSTISGGNDHTIQSAATHGFIGGGNVNTITAGVSSVIVGGASNTINTAATGLSFIGGGTTNSVTGYYSIIVGGDANTNASFWGSMVGGQQNTLNSQWGFCGGGFSNNVSGNGHVLVGGYDNTCIGSYSFVGGGEQNNHSNGNYNFLGAGQTNFMNSNWSVLVGGLSNSMNADFSTIVGGREASTSLRGEQAYSVGRFSITGDAQMSTLQMRALVTGTGIADLFLDGASIKAILPATNTLWAIRVQIAAICTNVGGGSTLVLGASFAAERQLAIKRLGTATTLVGAVQTIGANLSDTTMSTSAVTITANDTDEALRIQFTPPTTAGASSTIRVVATIQLTQVKY